MRCFLRTISQFGIVLFLSVPLNGCKEAQSDAGEGAPEGSVTITVDAGTKYQTIEGFGTALVTWSDRMNEFNRTPEFHEIYTKDLGFNFLRLNLWGPTLPQKVENWEDISYEDFDRTISRFEIYFEVAKAFRKINPDFKLIGTVWSPPAWMKANNAITDLDSGALDDPSEYVIDGEPAVNRVLPEYYPHFVKWMVEVVKLFDAEGIPLDAVSPANEPMFTQRFESCLWTAPELATITAMLGEQLEAEGYRHVLIYGPETMTGGYFTASNRVYLDAYMSNPRAAAQIDVFATHGYTDGFTADLSQDASAQFRELVADLGRPYWVTEGGTGGHEWPEPLTGVAAAAHYAFVSGHASAFVPWQVTGFEASTHELMVLDQKTKKTHAIRHFSLFIRPGAVRIDASPDNDVVKASAYVHPEEKTVTIVLINPTEADQDVQINLSGIEGVSSFDVYRTSATEDVKQLEAVAVEGAGTSILMPAESIVTLYGKQK